MVHTIFVAKQFCHSKFSFNSNHSNTKNKASIVNIGTMRNWEEQWEKKILGPDPEVFPKFHGLEEVWSLVLQFDLQNMSIFWCNYLWKLQIPNVIILC